MHFRAKSKAHYIPVSNVMSWFPGLRDSDSWFRILPGMSMSARCICRPMENKLTERAFIKKTIIILVSRSVLF